MTAPRCSGASGGGDDSRSEAAPLEVVEATVVQQRGAPVAEATNDVLDARTLADGESLAGRDLHGWKLVGDFSERSAALWVRTFADARPGDRRASVTYRGPSCVRFCFSLHITQITVFRV